MYGVRIRFADGHDLAFEVAPEQTVLEAAMQIDAPLRYDCAAGSCGACIAQLVEGATIFSPEGPSPISTAEAEAGLRPTCQTRLASPAVFDLPYALHPQPSPAMKHSALVQVVERISASVFRLSIERPEGFSFQAGQYVRLRPPRARSARAYSISSAPDDVTQLEFLIREVPGGVVSTWLAQSAAVGDRVVLQGPLGAFALDRAAAEHVFVVGGTGLAPALAMLREMGAARAALCFGVNTEADLFLEQELSALGEVGHDVRVAVLAGEPSAGRVLGTAVSLLRPEDVAPGRVYYLCGPPRMVEAARALLLAQGAPANLIRSERYLPSE